MRNLSGPSWPLQVLISIVFAFAFVAAANAKGQPVVTTALGRITGSLCAATNKTVARFIGIPYAQAPVGKLRWTAPKAFATPFPKDGYSATTPAPYCPQIPGDFNFWKALNQSEDCLYLNVWAPVNAKPSSKLPVRVWIHGGAYTSGGGIDPAFDSCQVAADGDVVAVTFNYRLGMLGYMALPELHDAAAGNTTGNWGLLDQRLALQWVQDNIAAFGGDPSRVMIHGESAGSTSVYAQALMPRSHGLFSRAVMHSGVFDFAMLFLKDAYAQGVFVQNLLGCNATAARARGFASTVDCLVASNVSDILGAQRALEFEMGQYPGATVDGSEYGFPQHPYLMQKDGSVARVPLIVGSNRHEGFIFLYLYLSSLAITGFNINQTVFENYVVFRGQVPPAFQQRAFALYNATEMGGYFEAAVAAGADVMFWCPMRRAASGFSRTTTTYGYFFPLVKPSSGCGLNTTLAIPYGDFPREFRNMFGAVHTYDIPFSFELPYASPEVRYRCRYTNNEAQMSAFVSGAWSNFAARGVPLPPKTGRLTAPQLLKVNSWPQWTPNASHALELDFKGPFDIEFDERVASRCALWDEMMESAVKAGTHFPEGNPLNA